MEFKQTLSFDDVLLEPQYSEIISRSDIDLSSRMRNILCSLPIISAPMDTVTEWQMVNKVHDAGGFAIVHRYNSIDEQIRQLREASYVCGAAIGVTGDCLERVEKIIVSGLTNIFCIDVAHGHHINVKKTILNLRAKYGQNITIIAGNVATFIAAKDLAEWGVDAIKVGVGSGSICSTRIQTGHGIPTFQSVLECSKIKNLIAPNVKIIADGGHKTTGDICKSLAAGADFVMLGSMLAGTAESPGELFQNPLTKTWNKIYRGMASEDSQIAWRGKVASKEGISVEIPYKGSVISILEDIKTNIRSGLSYTGAHNLQQFREKARFVIQTINGTKESSTHILDVGGKL